MVCLLPSTALHQICKYYIFLDFCEDYYFCPNNPWAPSLYKHAAAAGSSNFSLSSWEVLSYLDFYCLPFWNRVNGSRNTNGHAHDLFLHHLSRFLFSLIKKLKERWERAEFLIPFVPQFHFGRKLGLWSTIDDSRSSGAWSLKVDAEEPQGRTSLALEP